MTQPIDLPTPSLFFEKIVEGKLLLAAETVVAAAQRVVAASAAGRRVDAEVAPQCLRGGEGQEQREGDGGPPGPVPVRFLLHGASFCFAARAVVAVLSLHQGGAVRPYRRRRRRIPYSKVSSFEAVQTIFKLTFT